MPDRYRHASCCRAGALWYMCAGAHRRHAMQTGLPMTAASVVAGQSKLTAEQRMLLTSQLLPWAARAGSQCQDLMTIYYETHVDDELTALQQRWRIIAAPSFVESQPSAVHATDGWVAGHG